MWNFLSGLPQKDAGVGAGKIVSLQWFDADDGQGALERTMCVRKKKYLTPREEYFFLYWDSATAATKPGPLSAVERCDGAKVCLHVASYMYTRRFLSFQGTMYYSCTCIIVLFSRIIHNFLQVL